LKDIDLFFFDSGIRHYLKKGEIETDDELLLAEYYLTRSFPTVSEALSIFLNDELLHHPGTTWLYTTHGYTLLSAILERVSGEKKNFSELLKDLVVQQLGLLNTKLEYPHEIVANRSRYYCRRTTKEGLRNVAYVDLSYKWAGGGMISNVNDLLIFANTLLQCRQTKSANTQSTNQLLKAETIRELWSPVTATNKKGISYGLGWMIAKEKSSSVNEASIPEHIFHTGGAVGATSTLLMIPCSNNCSNPRCGICIVILTNLGSAGDIYQTALDIALLFRQISPCTSSYQL
jgi:serine beta-lactamase-like protein LACTB